MGGVRGVFRGLRWEGSWPREGSRGGVCGGRGRGACDGRGQGRGRGACGRRGQGRAGVRGRGRDPTHCHRRCLRWSLWSARCGHSRTATSTGAAGSVVAGALRAGAEPSSPAPGETPQLQKQPGGQQQGLFSRRGAGSGLPSPRSPARSPSHLTVDPRPGRHPSPGKGRARPALAWRRWAYCSCTSGMEEDTFCSISRSFFRLVLDSAWMPSRLILKAPEGPLISRKLPCSLARTAGPLGSSPSGTVAPDSALAARGTSELQGGQSSVGSNAHLGRCGAGGVRTVAPTAQPALLA